MRQSCGVPASASPAPSSALQAISLTFLIQRISSAYPDTNGLGAFEAVDGAADAQAAGPLEDVGVDHGRRDVAVAEKLLHGPDVVSVFQQVGGE